VTLFRWDDPLLSFAAAHRGRPAVLGGFVYYRTFDHLKEDGVCCYSPALRGRNSCYFRLNLRGRRLNLAICSHISLLLNILPASPKGSIFCRDFRLSPPVFSGFYGHREGEGALFNTETHRGGSV
jgi:hypothetical protein